MNSNPHLCGAPRRTGNPVGLPCRNRTAEGEEHCSDHGGASPKADAKRARRALEAAAMAS